MGHWKSNRQGIGILWKKWIEDNECGKSFVIKTNTDRSVDRLQGKIRIPVCRRIEVRGRICKFMAMRKVLLEIWLKEDTFKLQ